MKIPVNIYLNCYQSLLTATFRIGLNKALVCNVTLFKEKKGSSYYSWNLSIDGQTSIRYYIIFFVLVGATFLFQCCELKYEVSVWSKLMNEDSRWVAKRGDCLIFKVMFGDLKYSLTLWRLNCKKIKVNKWKLLLEAKSCKEMNQLGNWWLVMYSWIYLFLNLVRQCPLLLLLPNWLAVTPVKYQLNIL